jgi:hypothetical protein
MKKFTDLFMICMLAFGPVLMAQKSEQQLIQTNTHPETGYEILTDRGKPGVLINAAQVSGTKEAEINWNYTDPASIGSKIRVSETTGNTFMSWWLNDSRVSLFGNTSTPVWEAYNVSQWEYPIDMTNDGEWIAVGYDSVAQVYMPTSSVVFWEVILTGDVLGLQISDDGERLFIAENNHNNTGNALVSAYTIGEDVPDWTTSFEGNGTVFNGSDDGSRMVFCQYSGYNKMWVLDGENGDILFDDYYKNQNPPALSYDGSIILNGDYSGYAYLYQYNESLNTYEEKWNYKVGGGGTSVWVVGMAVSGDGSTVAVGTLIFLSGGGFEGEMYVFNSWSPVPLWIFSGAGDQLGSIDFSYDGSLIAAAGWGPLDHSKPDFFLFRKESSEPYFNILTQGSFNAVDLSQDGTLCSVTGKAVHARVLGSGGLLYNVTSDPGGGALAGNVTLENATDYSNVKIVINELEDYYGYSGNDGDYQIKYIPAGTYSVTASLIGYYPVIISDVEISEGEITALDFNLEETGNPPYNLMATKGAGITINLSWLSDNAGDLDGFNIYRKTIEGDLFPEEPLATVGNNELEWEDTDVLPLTNYYYAITAIIETDVESPYSNVDQGWMSSGFITDQISVYTGSTPTIDGTISAGEWDDAFMLDASDFLGKYDNMPNPVASVPMYFKVNAAMTELYVACVNNNDVVLEDHDEVALYIDDNNDGIYPAPGDDSEGNYWAAYYATGSEIRYRPIYSNGGVGAIVYLEDPQIAVSDATGVIVYEFMIPMGSDSTWQINPSADNQSSLFIFTLDDPTNFDAYWPCWNQEIFAPMDYGTITYGATDEIPTAPDEVNISWTSETPVVVTLDWTQPAINDFDHFNVYYAIENGNWELLSETIGTQLFYMPENTLYTEFYITTVDQAQQESVPSETVIFDFTSSITEPHSLSTLSVFPNPSSHQVNIAVDLPDSGEYMLRIYRSDGTLVHTLYSGHLDAGKNVFAWNVTNDTYQPVTDGIYFLNITGETTYVTQKIIVSNH